MKKDTIVQFICFATNLEVDAFAPNWEKFARRLTDKKADPSLQQQLPHTKTKYRYVSQHESPNGDFNFRFMNDRKSEHFPEQPVRVVQIGGYITVQFKKRDDSDESQVRVIAFVSHNETDIDYYRQLPIDGHLNIYQAYYESCTYGYVLEFFLPETDTEELLGHLKQRLAVEVGIYKDALVPHI